jgi:hypothetical protein
MAREHRQEVLISSTVRDLPEHREEIMHACLREGMFPKMMEHLPPSDEEAISVSLKMVRDEVRDGVGPHGQHPRLHPVHGG